MNVLHFDVEGVLTMKEVAELSSYLDGWQEFLLEDGRDTKTIRLYRSTVVAFLAWHGIKTMARAELHSYVRYLQADHVAPGATHAGLRPRTIRRTFTALRSFWKYLRTLGIELPAIEAITLPRMDTARRRVPTDTEVRSLFAAADRVGIQARSEEWFDWQRRRARCVLSLLAGCALRRSELLALDVSDLRQVGADWVVAVRKGKMGQSRQVPIAGDYLNDIADWLTARDLRRLRLDHADGPLFYDDKGNRMAQHSLETLWDALLRIAGLEESGLTPHGLRHWAATGILKSSSAKVAQAYLGHASVLTTMTVYAHCTSDDLALAAGRLATAIHTPQRQPETVPPRRDAVPAARPAGRVRRSARTMLRR